jgi:F0F1-type ATP synthase membrane subunit b/b'
MNIARRAAFAVMVLVAGWGLLAHAAPSPEERAVQAQGQQRQQQHVGGASPRPMEEQELAPINWTEFGRETPPFIAMIVNFGILAAGYYLLGRKPIATALQSRRDSIAKEIEEAQKIRQEAEARAKVYQAKLDTLAEDVRAAREALLRAGEAERDRIVSEAEAKAERMRKDAEFILMQEVKQMRQDLWREALESATLAAEKLLKQRVTAEDQERLAEDYLAELGGKRSERAGSSEEHKAAGPVGSGAESPS